MDSYDALMYLRTTLTRISKNLRFKKWTQSRDFNKKWGIR
jgi:hypothetical protein